MNKKLKLEQALQNGKLSHALILECADNPPVENARFFSDLFRAFLCVGVQSVRDPGACGKCDSCLIPLGLEPDEPRQHPDFYYARPTAETGYSVDQVRDWGAQFLYLSRNLSPRKLLVVSEAEKLCGTQQAPANALLKILEEPRSESFLILLTAKPYRLISTVRSRCLKISFRPEMAQSAPKTPAEGPIFDEILALFGPATGEMHKSALSTPGWWKERAVRIHELEVCHARLWNRLKASVSALSRDEALVLWHRWKHFEDFLAAVKLYGNPPLHWLNLKRKVKGELPWRISKLFG